MQSSVILVDRHDNPTGTTAKIDAHLQPLLHRAFSILVFDSQQRLLLQKRANDKYHSAGLWSNTCCSHLYSQPAAIDLKKSGVDIQFRLIRHCCSLFFLFR